MPNKQTAASRAAGATQRATQHPRHRTRRATPHRALPTRLGALIALAFAPAAAQRVNCLVQQRFRVEV